MPAVTVVYAFDIFEQVDRTEFKAVAKAAVARHMDAIDPHTGERTNYAEQPNKFIDLVLIGCDPDDIDATAMFMATIVTYGWPDRMANIQDRLRRINEEIRAVIPDSVVSDGMDGINTTFLAKGSGCWHAA
jgi:hypothetical protein